MAKANVTIAISGTYNSRALERAQKDLERLNIRSVATADGIGGTFVRAGGKVAEFGGAVYGVGKKADALGSTLTNKVSMPMALVGAACGAAAIEIDSSLTSVKKTVDGTTEDYENLKQAAIDFSKTNAVSASQILDMQALGAQLGFNIDELNEFSKVASGLEIATDMGAEQAATEMAQFANITNMAHDKIGNYASAIVELGNNLATTESKISSMGQRVAAAGTQVGMSQAEILGWSAAMSSLGVEAEAGGTAFSQTISTIDKAVATGGKKLDAFAKAAGMSSEDFANSWKQSSTDTLLALLKSAGGAENLTVTLEEMGVTGIRQSDVLKRLSGNTDLVAKSLGLANQGWQENTALQKEVDNRNESMAAKLEILQNKVIAVAESVGKPLVEAAIEFVDAAEPVLTVVSDAAKAFSEMDESEQRQIVSMVALVAAAGPLLSIGGKLAKGLGSITVGLGKVMQGTGVAISQTKTATKATEGMEKAMSTASKGAGLLKGALGGIGVGLAITGATMAIGYIISELEKAREKAANLRAATKELSNTGGLYYSAFAEAAKGSLGKIDASLKTTTENQSSYRQELGNTQAAVDEMIKKNGELSETLAGIFSEAGSKAGILDVYSNAISNLADQSDLSDDKVSELKLAVDNVNQALGTNFEVIKDPSGSYKIFKEGVEVAKEEVLKLIKAQQDQIALNANKQAYEEAYKTLGKNAKTAADAQKNLTKKTEEYNAAEAEYEDALASGAEGLDGYGIKLSAAKSAMDNAKKSLDDANAVYDSQNTLVKNLKDNQLLYQQALDQGSGSISASLTNNQLLMATLESNGQSALNFKNKLTELGITQDNVTSLGSEKMVSLAQSYDGSVSSITGKLSEFGLSLDQSKINSATATEEIKNHIISAGDTVSQELANSGIDVDAFVQKLKDSGVPVQDLKTLTEDQLTQLAQSYKNNGGDIKGQLDQFIADNNKAGTDGGSGLVSNAEAGLNAGKPEIYRATVELSNTANSGLGSADTWSTGKNFVLGFVGGLGHVNIWRAAWNIGQSALGAIKNALGIHSPSKEAMKVGEFFGEGAVIGMQSTHKAIEAEAQAMSEAMELSPRAYNSNYNSAYASAGRGGNNTSTRNITINLTVNANTTATNAALTGQQIGEALYNEYIKRERAFA